MDGLGWRLSEPPSRKDEGRGLTPSLGLAHPLPLHQLPCPQPSAGVGQSGVRERRIPTLGIISEVLDRGYIVRNSEKLGFFVGLFSKLGDTGSNTFSNKPCCSEQITKGFAVRGSAE